MIIHNGTAFWPILTRLKSTCQIDVTYFPYDEQECKLKFGSWTYNGYRVSIEQRIYPIELFIYLFIYPYRYWCEVRNIIQAKTVKGKKKERKEKIQQESIVYFSTDTTLIATKVGRR